jgi:adenosylcobinamide kinase / adenosylcobinamide-phosphate guanylyltransferase
VTAPGQAAPAASTTLVTGPVRSGKSRHAEHLLRLEPAVTYVATGRRVDPADPADAEWSRRVVDHQVRRPPSWRTVETTDVAAVIEAARGAVLVDCLGTWLTALVDEAGWHDLDAAADRVRSEGRRLVETLGAARLPVVVVTNEVGWSLVPTTVSGRFFQDELGRLNAQVAAASAAVHLVVAGRVIDLSEAAVVPMDSGPTGPTASAPSALDA